MDTYRITSDRLKHSLDIARCASANPKLFVIKGTQPNECRYRHHHFIYTEKKYCDAVTIARVCRNCGLGIGEAFPSRKNYQFNCIAKHSETGGVL